MYGATMDSCIVVDSVGGVVGDVTAEWSLIEDGWPGVGNFDLDPLLADPYGGDFSLLPHSPCIDRGNPSLPADPDGSRRDMGAEPWVWEQVSASYCESNPNSTGSTAVCRVTGFTSVDTNFVRLVADFLPHDQTGFFLTSRTQGFVPLFAGLQGNLCLGEPIVRLDGPGQVLDSGSSGSASLELSLTLLHGGESVLAGETWHYQYWYRDNDPMPTANTTGGVLVGFD